jgi:hypothetical protein
VSPSFTPNSVSRAEVAAPDSSSAAMPKSPSTARAAILDEHVARPQVAVDDAALVRGGQCRGDRREQPAGVAEVERRAGRDDFLHRAAVDVLHDHVGHIAGQPANAIHRSHVRVRDARGRLRLALEALPRDGIRGHVRPQHLHRHQPLQRRLAGEVHVRRGAAAELPQDLEVRLQPGERRRVRAGRFRVHHELRRE